MRRLVRKEPDADLLQIIDALAAASRFARGLHGRQKQRNQNTDDRNDDQELNQCETALPAQSNASRWGARIRHGKKFPGCSDGLIRSRLYGSLNLLPEKLLRQPHGQLSQMVIQNDLFVNARKTVVCFSAAQRAQVSGEMIA
jgi:hypothetical protein